MGVMKAELIPKTKRESKYAVIFVHGLHGDPDGTWRKDKKSKSLPELFAMDSELNEVDVYSFGYPSNIIIRYDFKEVCKILYSEVKARLGDKGIIFVAHSMGGLVVQQYIIDQFEQFNTTVVEQVKGIVYLAVPFEGSAKAKFVSMIIPYHRQVNSLVEKNPVLDQLKGDWVKYVFRGGHENLPDALRITLPQFAIYGARDWIVSKRSASPFHVGAEVITSDTGHKDICKVDQSSTEYMHIKKFILEIIASKNNNIPMVIHAHGWDKQGYQEEAHYPLDWTKHFRISASPRILPSIETWTNEIIPQIEFISAEWSEKWVRKGGIVRIYTKMCLTGGLLLGSRFSFTKGVKLEVAHNGNIWAADRSDADYKAKPKIIIGNSAESQRAILILGVTKDVQNEVEQYLSIERVLFKKIVNLLPPNGTGPNSIENSEQALSYAISVKSEIEQLKSEGIKEIFLFLNTPISVALFVGHRLTATCPIQTFEYNGIGYTSSCLL